MALMINPFGGPVEDLADRHADLAWHEEVELESLNAMAPDVIKTICGVAVGGQAQSLMAGKAVTIDPSMSPMEREAVVNAVLRASNDLADSVERGVSIEGLPRNIVGLDAEAFGTALNRAVEAGKEIEMSFDQGMIWMDVHEPEPELDGPSL